MIVRGSIHTSPIRPKKPQQVLRYDSPKPYLETRYRCSFTPEARVKKDLTYSVSPKKVEFPTQDQVRYYIRKAPVDPKIHREIPNELESRIFPDKFVEKFDPFKPIESVSEMDKCISAAKDILNRSKSSCSTRPVSAFQSPDKRSINSSRREDTSFQHVQASIKSIENSAKALREFSVHMLKAADAIKATAEELHRSAKAVEPGQYYNRNQYPHPWRMKK
jgi:hypothetical protein